MAPGEERHERVFSSPRPAPGAPSSHRVARYDDGVRGSVGQGADGVTESPRVIRLGTRHVRHATRPDRDPAAAFPGLPPRPLCDPKTTFSSHSAGVDPTGAGWVCAGRASRLGA
ncbi:hypothetical protein GCM10027075_19730 [Streptomyces heilongjiangensis]